MIYTWMGWSPLITVHNRLYRCDWCNDFGKENGSMIGRTIRQVQIIAFNQKFIK
jgi:hypothetical protein